MEHIFEHWYSRKPIPEKEKEKIKNMVKGKHIDWLDLGDVKSLLCVDGTTFRNVFVENRKFLFKGDFTAPSDENDYLDAKNYITDDGLAGFSITKSGWLVSLFSNYEKGGFARAIKNYVISDAYKLVCIVADTDEGNGLIKLYESVYGFRKYAKTLNDVEVMSKYYGKEFIDNFVSKNGMPFHVFMIGKNAEGESSEIKEFQDYFVAEEYINRTVKK